MFSAAAFNSSAFIRQRRMLCVSSVPRFLPARVSRMRLSGGLLPAAPTSCPLLNPRSHEIVVVGDAQQGLAVSPVVHTIRRCASLFGSQSIDLRALQSVIHASPVLPRREHALSLLQGPNVSLSRRRLDQWIEAAILDKHPLSDR